MLLVAIACTSPTELTSAKASPADSIPCAVSATNSIAGAITSPMSDAELTGARSALVPNGDFSNGINGWFISDPGTARLERSDRDDGEKLRIVGDATKTLRYVNSPRFPVMAGAGYKLVVGAGVTAVSAGLGAFSLVFVSTGEMSRKLSRFDPPSGSERYFDYAVTGTVPPGVRQAFVQVSYMQNYGAIDLSLYGVSYAETGDIEVTGWAAAQSRATDPTPGIASVSLYLDGPRGTGTIVGTATYGDKRDDVARACGDLRFTNSGWHYSWDIRSVAPGAHTLYATLQATDGMTSEVRTRIVRAPAFRDDPVGGVDVPVDGTTLPEVSTLSGWAIDRNDPFDTGVDTVSVFLDGAAESGKLLGNAASGDARPGVGLHFGEPRFGRSGWHFTWDSSAVARGAHTLSFVLHSSATGRSTTISRTVFVGGGREISRGRPTRTSSTLEPWLPALAVDGVETTWWSSGKLPTGWIEIDLEGSMSIERMRLVVAQWPATGFTTHRVFGRGVTGADVLLHEFSGVTENGQVLEYSPPAPWTGIRFVRVETIDSLSWVAWSEIALFSAGSTPTGSLSGQVRSAEIPVVGAQVELRTGTEVVQSVFTDRDGAYAFVGIPPGAYSVRAYGPSPAYARVAEIGSQILGVRANLIVEPIVLTPR